MSNIKLKPIKPGMVIHCQTEQEANQLIKWAYKSGWRWNGGGSAQETLWDEYQEETCYRFREDNSITYAYTEYFVENSHRIIEFFDLIELTAEELLDTLSDIKNCKGRICADCPLSNNFCAEADAVFIKRDNEKLLEICKQWKADHEKKEPEVEWVDICRIIETLPDGRKRCAHEEDIKLELPFGGDEKEKIEEILKWYCTERDGNFFAVHEVICRVKQ